MFRRKSHRADPGELSEKTILDDVPFKRAKGRARYRETVRTKLPSVKFRAPEPGELVGRGRRRSGTSPTVLTAAQRIFVTAYLQNGFNGRRAYLEAHPKASLRTADVEASKNLNIPKVRQWLARRLEPIWKSRQMGGEQALARIAQIAGFDVRTLYDAQGALLPVDQWPDTVVGVVRSVQDGPYGLKVGLESPHAALRTILEQCGKLRTPGESLDALAEALRADLTRHGHAEDV